MKKEFFEAPEIEIMTYEYENIMTLSGGGQGGDDGMEDDL